MLARERLAVGRCELVSAREIRRGDAREADSQAARRGPVWGEKQEKEGGRDREKAEKEIK